MKKRTTFLVAALPVCLLVAPAFADDGGKANSATLQSQPATANSQVKDSQKTDNQNALQSILTNFNFAGGISAGGFYTSHAGEGNSDNEWMLSNLIFEVSSKDQNALMGFTAAVGETSTPSILGSPGTTNSLDVEYASVYLKPEQDLNIAVGLLQPNAGYESSYTYNNKNTFLGALASQQPYNAYGVQVSYELKRVKLVGGYYKDRLADDEYASDDSSQNDSWEVGISTTVLETSFSIYHYHVENLRNLTGAVLERSVGNVDLGFNVDYWRWDESVADNYGDDSSIGAAFYITPHFGKFSLPMRLEYINQGKSGFFLESAQAENISSVTVSPTYHFTDNAYIRADFAYVHADDGFADSDGNLKNEQVCLAAEIGYTF
jgi:Putative beta-barrel porin-2, OmpL-like. bbp2